MTIAIRATAPIPIRTFFLVVIRPSTGEYKDTRIDDPSARSESVYGYRRLKVSSESKVEAGTPDFFTAPIVRLGLTFKAGGDRKVLAFIIDTESC